MAGLGGRLVGVELPILTDRLSLRLHRDDDAAPLARYVNDRRILRGIRAEPHRYTSEEELQYVRKSRRAASRGELLLLAVTLQASGELIGGIGLHFRSANRRMAGLGYWLRAKYWHLGYGSEAAAAMCRLGFTQLKLHRIEAKVFDSNPRSMQLLRRLGFKTEGHARETRRLGGRWEGETTFGLLEKDFTR